MKFVKFLCRMSLMLSILTAAASASQASGISYTVSPMTKEITIAAGSETTGTLEIRNDDPKPSLIDGGLLHLKVYFADWSLDSTGAMSFCPPGTTASSCAAWFQINPPEMTIKPGTTTTLRYTIQVPQNASGTYHTLLMFESAPIPETINARNVSVNGRIGVTLYLQVGPQVKRAKITAFDVTNLRTSITVANTGTSQIRLKGTLKFTDQQDHLLAEVPVPNALILPGNDGNRVLSLDTPKLPSGTPVTATAVLDYGSDTLLGARTHVTVP